MKRRDFVKTIGAGLLSSSAILASTSSNSYGAKDVKVRWRMVTSWPPAFPILQTGAEALAKRVGELTQNHFQIQVFAGGELVPPLGVFDAVSQGTVQCGHTASYYWAGKCAAAQWFTSVPFGLDAQGMNSWLYYGDGLKLWEEVYANFGLISRPAGNTGVQMGGWFNKEIKTLDDFKGLKMRIPGLGGKVVKEAGGTVVLLPAGEIYTSLERGVIDATEWVGPYHDLRMGFHKIAKYYYGPGWHEPGSVLELMINKKAYEALPTEFKAALDTAAAETNIKMLSEFEDKNSKALAELHNNSKVKLKIFPDKVMTELRNLAKDVLAQEAAKDPLATKVHKNFTNFKARLHNWSNLSEKPYYTRVAG